MREILFRAKAINRDPDQEYCTEYKNGDWVYGLVEKLPIIKNGEKVYDTDCAEMRNTCGVSGIDVDENTICEFTGSTDKNDTEIFEDDLCYFFDSNCGEDEVLKVVYEDGGYWLRGDGWAVSFSQINTSTDVEVIGNIYDNPELLEAK